MARKKFSDEQIAQILVEGAYKGDIYVSQQYGITDRTVRNWKNRLGFDVKFSKLFHDKKRLFEREWATELPVAIKAAIEACKRSVQSLDPSDPNGAHAIAGILKILSEIATMREVLDARLAGQNREDDPQD